MIMEVVPERLDVRDRLVPPLRCDVSWKEYCGQSVLHLTVRERMLNTKGDVADLSVTTVRQALHTLKLERWLIAEQHLWGILDRSSPCVDELLSIRVS